MDSFGLPTAFYCVSDDRYFLGTVALVNSLRLQGHAEPVFVLDCGLAPQQRDLLEGETTVLRSTRSDPPWLLKCLTPLERPADVMVLLDTDMIVTKPLRPLISQAAGGKVIAFENPIQRFVPEWGELLDLERPRRQGYVGSGALCVEGHLGTEILGLLAKLQSRIDFERTFWRANEPDYPFLYGDQDVLNAILATRVDAGRIVALDERLAPTPPFAGLRVVDEAGLRCAYDDGVEPYLVHHFVVKPWLEETHHGVYSRLLRRLLIGPDVAIRVSADQLPVRLRRGVRAFAARNRVNLRERFRWHVREPLRTRIGPRHERSEDGR